MLDIVIWIKSGERRIRTFVAEATDLQSVPFDRSGISPSGSTQHLFGNPKLFESKR
jgi:hypothetical protein